MPKNKQQLNRQHSKQQNKQLLNRRLNRQQSKQLHNRRLHNNNFYFFSFIKLIIIVKI